jgi:hypothetical protein
MKIPGDFEPPARAGARVDIISMNDKIPMDDGPLPTGEARRRIRAILAQGVVGLSRHAEEEMRKDGTTAVDVANVSRGGVVEPAEWENGTWRYRVRTAHTTVVVAFRSPERLVVVTAWRNR